MNFEVVHGSLTQRNLEQCAIAQIKVPVRVELTTNAKKILNVTAACFIGGAERTESGVNVTGKVTTRVIFIDESDGFNSQDHENTWVERLTLKDAAAIISLAPSAHILESQAASHINNDGGLITEVQTSHVINVAVLGLTGKEVRYVSALRGGVETKCQKRTVANMRSIIHEKFEISETFALGADVEGILGVELNTCVRDINVTDGRVTIKGMAYANVTAAKSMDGSSHISNTFFDWDFTKSLNINDITMNDIISGHTTVANLSIKVENRGHPELVISAEILFTGHATTAHEIETVEDAFAYEHNLDFAHCDISDTQATTQVNIFADIEGNMTMPDGSAFISKILAVNGMQVSGINAVATDGKVTVEGVLTTPMTFECEEKQIHPHIAQVPFSTVCKIDGITKHHNISVAVTPLNCNIKARRGKELLVDARIAVNACAHTMETHKVTSGAALGSARPRDDSAIIIHIAGKGESLWQVAKRISMSTAEIIKQNPSTEQGITAGERIVLYRQEAVNF